MSRQIPLPNGDWGSDQWVVFRDPDEMRGRDVEVVQAAAMSAAPALSRLPDDIREKKEGETDEDVDKRVSDIMLTTSFTPEENLSILGLRRAAFIALLQSWSLRKPLPTLGNLADLPKGLYAALLSLVDMGAIGDLTSDTDFNPTPDRESPTGGSTPSVEPSEESQPSMSTPASVESGESTVIEVSTLD